MITKPLAKVLVAATLWAFASSAFAVSITADPDNAKIFLGDEITVTITGDFNDDPTLGGGLDIDWNTGVLDLVSWDPIDWGGDPGFFNPGDVDAVGGSISSFAAGNFGGITGPVTMASITFVAVGAGNGGVVMSDDSDGAAGPFVSAITFAIQSPDFGNPNIDVNVPLPAAVWLMLGGLGVLGGLRRKI